MRKADLIDAILDAANGGNDAGDANGAAEKPATRRVRSARASQVQADDPIAALAAEEDALGADAGDADDAPMPRPGPGGRARRPPPTTTDARPRRTRPGGVDRGGFDRRGRLGRGPTTADEPADEPESPRAPPRQPRRRRPPRTTARPTSVTTTVAATVSTPRTSGSRSARATAAAGAVAAVAAARSSRAATPAPPSSRAIRSRSRACSTSATRATASCARGGYLPAQKDVYVSASQVRRFALRKGDFVTGTSRPQASNEKYPALLRVDDINGLTPDDARVRPRFEDLTPLFPDSKLRLELPTTRSEITGRIVDLISPIGKGQRGLIVSPPKAGKTTILKQLVYSIERNNPEVHLMVLLVDERPEEVTDMRRHVLQRRGGGQHVRPPRPTSTPRSPSSPSSGPSAWSRWARTS